MQPNRRIRGVSGAKARILRVQLALPTRRLLRQGRSGPAFSRVFLCFSLNSSLARPPGRSESLAPVVLLRTLGSGKEGFAVISATNCSQTEGFHGSCAQTTYFTGPVRLGLHSGLVLAPSRAEARGLDSSTGPYKSYFWYLRGPVPAVFGTTLAALLCLKEQTRQEETRPEGTRQEETRP